MVLTVLRIKPQIFTIAHKTLQDLGPLPSPPTSCWITSPSLLSSSKHTGLLSVLLYTPSSFLTEGYCLFSLPGIFFPQIFIMITTFCDLDFSTNIRSELGLFWALKFFPPAHQVIFHLVIFQFHFCLRPKERGFVCLVLCCIHCLEYRRYLTKIYWISEWILLLPLFHYTYIIFSSLLSSPLNRNM